MFMMKDPIGEQSSKTRIRGLRKLPRTLLGWKAFTTCEYATSWVAIDGALAMELHAGLQRDVGSNPVSIGKTRLPYCFTRLAPKESTQSYRIIRGMIPRLIQIIDPPRIVGDL